MNKKFFRLVSWYDNEWGDSCRKKPLNGTIDRVIVWRMSTLTEIEAALPGLSERELKQLAAAVDRQFRERKGSLIYQDAHGVETEADLLLAADRAFQEYDRVEETDYLLCSPANRERLLKAVADMNANRNRSSTS